MTGKKYKTVRLQRAGMVGTGTTFILGSSLSRYLKDNHQVGGAGRKGPLETGIMLRVVVYCDKQGGTARIPLVPELDGRFFISFFKPESYGLYRRS